MELGESWSGRICCPLPQSETCRRACITATSSDDLTQGCRKSDEIAFFNCLERQNLGETCCGHSRTNDCKDACFDIFRSRLTPTRQQRNLVIAECEHSSPKVLNCVKNFTKVTPATNIHKRELNTGWKLKRKLARNVSILDMRCCDKSNKSKCRETCKNVLSVPSTHQEIIDALQIGGCGPPLLQVII